MNSLNTLYFPITTINCQRQFPLFLFFRSIHLISIMEKEGDKESADSFMDSDFCQVHTPAPLGKDRDRFLRLLEDIRSRQDDYAAQLKNLTLAAFSRKKDDSDSESAILAALTGKAPATDPQKDRREEELWKARLVLGIAEIVDLEEEEVASHLALLEGETQEILSAITGDVQTEDEDVIDSLNDLGRCREPIHAGDMGNRLSNWRRLFKESSMKSYEILLTTCPTCGETILEDVEEKTNTKPLLLARFPLPLSIGETQSQALAAAQGFTAENQEVLADLNNLLESASTTGPDSAAGILDEWTTNWHRVIDKNFPSSRYGRQELRLFYCNGLDSTTLLSPVSTATPCDTKKAAFLTIVS